MHLPTPTRMGRKRHHNGRSLAFSLLIVYANIKYIWRLEEYVAHAQSYPSFSHPSNGAFLACRTRETPKYLAYSLFRRGSPSGQASISGPLFLMLPRAGFAGRMFMSAESYGLSRSIGGCSGMVSLHSHNPDSPDCSGSGRTSISISPEQRTRIFLPF